MSQPFSRLLHPFDVARHPSFEPEVKRAILANRAPEHLARGNPGHRRLRDAKRAVPIDNFLNAMHSLDDIAQEKPLLQ